MSLALIFKRPFAFIENKGKVKPSGFSLIEVLVATLINSLLIVGLLSMLSNSGTLQQQAVVTTSRLNDINFAIQQLSVSTSHAIEVNLSGTTHSYFYTGHCGTHLSCTNETSNGSQIAIIQPKPINEEHRDCTGQRANINANDILVSVYWVSNNNHGNQSLFCRGYNLTQNTWVRNGRSAALVDNIERLEALYLVKYNQRYRYLQPQNISDWNSVVAIKTIIFSQANTHQQNTQTLIPLVNNSGLFKND